MAEHHQAGERHPREVQQKAGGHQGQRDDRAVNEVVQGCAQTGGEQVAEEGEVGEEAQEQVAPVPSQVEEDGDTDGQEGETFQAQEDQRTGERVDQSRGTARGCADGYDLLP